MIELGEKNEAFTNQKLLGGVKNLGVHNFYGASIDSLIFFSYSHEINQIFFMFA